MRQAIELAALIPRRPGLHHYTINGEDDLIRIAIVAVLLTILIDTAEGNSMFRLIQCQGDDDSVGLVFRDEKSARLISFMGSYQEFAITRPGERALLRWQNVSTVEITRVGDSTHGIMLIRLKPGRNWFGEETIEFGEIDEECWQTLKDRFSSELRFVEHAG